MILHNEPVIFKNGVPTPISVVSGKEKTLAYQILSKHSVKEDSNYFHIRFDSLTSHDITYVGIIQTARASGMKKFPMPYVLTNCHNTLCAVGGTINEDDHQFALSAAKKYGGIYVPPCFAVIHSYNREMMSGCGRMILGSDSHTRYGALGTMGIGEGGGELAKQLVGRTYDIAKPEVVLVYVHGKPRFGIGPHDVALAIVGAVYANGFVKNRVMEFVGPGIQHLSQDFRNGIDVMTTETACLSSIWQTDEVTEQYFIDHGRKEAYAKLTPQEEAGYDKWIDLDLSQIHSMIAMPMHPSFAITIHELQQNPQKYLQEAQDRCNAASKVPLDLMSKIQKDGSVKVEQGIIAGCAGGTYENIVCATQILKGKDVGNDTFKLSVYPDSMPVYKALVENGCVSELISTGTVIREAFCGPCFGAGDTPANNELSIRHTTRNFPNREGSKPNEGQISAVALMDARSIAATAINHGILTAAEDIVTHDFEIPACHFDASIYEKRVYNGWGKANESVPLHFGPNIKDWPTLPALPQDLLVQIVSHIDDEVTTTDELIPSGETSSFRSNPLRLAEFTLSRRDPSYVPQAKQVQALRSQLHSSNTPEEIQSVLDLLSKQTSIDLQNIDYGSAIYAKKPGDGSAREQAASCQRVLGTWANFAKEYATKRYRSNCINWGILPLLTHNEDDLTKGSYVYIPNIASQLLKHSETISGYIVKIDHTLVQTTFSLGTLTKEEKEILIQGCLINHYKNEAH